MWNLFKNLYISTQKNSESTKIRQKLDGLQKIRDQKVDISNHRCLTLSEYYAWLAVIALPFVICVLIDYNCEGKPYWTLLQLGFLEYAILDAPDRQIFSLWKKSPLEKAFQ